MKYLYPLVAFILISQLLKAQTDSSPDTSANKKGRVFTSIEKVPSFPGGTENFYRYLAKNLKYPDVARLVGINGKLRVSFVVDKDGSIIDAAPINCIGAGCEAEAVKLLENSPKWSPGMQNSRPVRVAFSVPITFSSEPRIVKMSELRQSGYGFVFNIKGSLYTIDEAEKILGVQFQSTSVDIAEPFFNYNKIEKFNIRGKKDVYLVIMKSS